MKDCRKPASNRTRSNAIANSSISTYILNENEKMYHACGILQMRHKSPAGARPILTKKEKSCIWNGG